MARLYYTPEAIIPPPGWRRDPDNWSRGYAFTGQHGVYNLQQYAADAWSLTVLADEKRVVLDNVAHPHEGFDLVAIYEKEAEQAKAAKSEERLTLPRLRGLARLAKAEIEGARDALQEVLDHQRIPLIGIFGSSHMVDRICTDPDPVEALIAATDATSALAAVRRKHEHASLGANFYAGIRRCKRTSHGFYLPSYTLLHLLKSFGSGIVHFQGHGYIKVQKLRQILDQLRRSRAHVDRIWLDTYRGRSGEKLRIFFTTKHSRGKFVLLLPKLTPDLAKRFERLGQRVHHLRIKDPTDTTPSTEPDDELDAATTPPF